MEHGNFEDIRRAHEAFVKQSTLEVILPTVREIDASAAQDWQRIPTRTSVYLDELTSILLILKTTAPSSAIEVLLPHLELTTSAYATNVAAEGTAPNTNKYEIAVNKASASEGISTAKVGVTTHIVWTQILHVTRPRRRLQNPAVYFTATLSLKPDFVEQEARAEKQYLPSFQALPANVLESLSLVSGDEKVYLSEARLTKVVPPAAPQQDDALRPLRGASKRALPLVPAIIPRLRRSATSEKVFVNVQIEASHTLSGKVTVHSVSCAISGARVRRLGDDVEHSILQQGDEIALLYEVAEIQSLEKSATLGHAVVDIKATVDADEGTTTELDITWKCFVDVPTDMSARYSDWKGEPLPKSRIYRIGLADSQTETVTFDISAPKSVSIRTGKPFELTVGCVNRSKRERRFAVKALESTLSIHNAIATNPDVKIGSIHRGECFEAALSYTALKAGVLNLGRLRIVDLDSGESIEIQDLPDVVVHE